jgi:cytidylate kinase
MFRVLTIAREYGAGGSAVAQMVADRLGWRLLDRALLGAVGATAQVDTETAARYDEHVDSWWRRFHRAGLWALAVSGGFPPADAQFFDAATIADSARQVIARAAVSGNCVIVGRGAQCILRGHADVFHVFIYGPWRERVSRVRSRLKSARKLGELIRWTDHERASYIRTYYGCDWKDPHLYQMMISSQIGTENAASIIVEAVLQGGTRLFRPPAELACSRDGGRG